MVIPYEIGWFTAFHQGFELVTKAVENLIAQGVDETSRRRYYYPTAEAAN